MIGLWLCVLVVGCDESQTPAAPAEKSETQKRLEAERSLLSNDEKLWPELAKRLVEAISVRDGILGVQSRSDSYFLPANSPWVIKCGGGLSIVFGNSISGDQSGTENDIQVYLLSTYIDSEICSRIGPRLAKGLIGHLKREQQP